MKLQDVIDAVFVPQCGACGRPGAGVCEACVPIGEPLVRDLPTLRVHAAGEYDGALKRCILALKRGRRDVARALALRLAMLMPASALLVPVPTTLLRRWERGFDGCELMARAVGGVLAQSGVAAGLSQTRGDHQRGRSRSERLAAHGRFQWRGEALGGRKVVLLDDVVTTGATLEDCARAVRSAGGIVDSAVALALTLKEVPQSSLSIASTSNAHTS